MLEGISEPFSKKIKLKEFKKCLVGVNYQKDFVNYLLRSINQEMYFRKFTKTSLSIFDNERNYLDNFTSLPRN